MNAISGGGPGLPNAEEIRKRKEKNLNKLK
jgi:hypothetical protein